MIDAIDVQRRIAAFDQMHGTPVRSGVWVYYADGATRDGNQLGPMNEPPKEPMLRCRNIVRYHQILLDRKVREFDELKDQLREGNGWVNEKENLKRLRRARHAVKTHKQNLEAAELELKRNMPGYLPPEEQAKRRQSEAETEAARNQYHKNLDEINI